MKTQHTPAPWTIKEHEDKNHGIDITEGDNGKVIANVTSHFIAEHTEAQANAKLIAAAPELLEALKELIEYLGEEWQQDQFIIKAQAAINKATS